MENLDIIFINSLAASDTHTHIHNKRKMSSGYDKCDNIIALMRENASINCHLDIDKSGS